MLYFFAGLALLLLLVFTARAFVKADPNKLAKTLRIISGWTMIALAGLLALRGLFPIALPMAFAGAMLLGKSLPFMQNIPGGFGPFAGRADKTQGQDSRVRTDHLEMTLDHDSGEMNGEIVKGKHKGSRLADLDRGTLLGLHADYCRSDPKSGQLLEAYLDRVHDGWREEAGMGAGQSGSGRYGTGAMSIEEALDILGLEPDAGSKEITGAHRNLMKKLHPDQGGSTYLAAMINQAKDVLLENAES